MKPTTPRRTRRLLARAATMNQETEEFDDYGPEPNMKLSHAFLVVLMLHVVAVGGLYLFTSMKAERRSALPGEGGKAASSRAESGGGGSNGSPKGGGEKPPSDSKPAPVAKTAESNAGNEARGTEAPSGTASAVSPLSRARGILGKLTGAVAGGGSAARVAAQETAPSNNPAQAVQEMEASPAEGGTYTVKGGDTLTRIAATLGVPVPDLEKVNGLSANSVLQVGQVLKVPAATPAQLPPPATNGSAVPAPSTVENAVPQPGAQTTGYTVVKGDNPWKIAKKFKISQEELMKANGITDPKKIQIGQMLTIPAPAARGSKPKP